LLSAVQIVYVAPMKALAAEMVRNFGQRLSALGITVQELTGDMQLSKSEIMKTQVRNLLLRQRSTCHFFFTFLILLVGHWTRHLFRKKIALAVPERFLETVLDSA